MFPHKFDGLAEGTDGINLQIAKWEKCVKLEEFKKTSLIIFSKDYSMNYRVNDYINRKRSDIRITLFVRFY